MNDCTPSPFITGNHSWSVWIFHLHQTGRAWVEWEKWGWVLPVPEPWKSVSDTVHSALKNKSIHSFIIIIIIFREYTHTHTHRTQLVYRKHLDTITRSAERRATVFVAAGVRGRENKQDRYLHTGKKERETHPDSSARQSHEHGCLWAWWEKDIKIINITELIRISRCMCMLSHICYMSGQKYTLG